MNKYSLTIFPIVILFGTVFFGYGPYSTAQMNLTGSYPSSGLPSVSGGGQSCAQGNVHCLNTPDQVSGFGGVLGSLLSSIGLVTFTVIAFEGMILVIALVGLRVSVFGSTVNLSETSIRGIIMTVPVVVVFSILFTLALPVMNAWPLGIGVGLTAVLSLTEMFGLMGMISYG